LHEQGVKIVGTVPAGLPPLTGPLWDLALWKELAVPALLISVVGFVEPVSVGQNSWPWAPATWARPSPAGFRSPAASRAPW
jgi:hypothetical protein